MKKNLPKILISFLALVIFLAPVGASLQKQGGHLAIETNIAFAAISANMFSVRVSVPPDGLFENQAKVNIFLTPSADGNFEEYRKVRDTFLVALNYKHTGATAGQAFVKIADLIQKGDQAGVEVSTYVSFSNLDADTEYIATFMTNPLEALSNPEEGKISFKTNPKGTGEGTQTKGALVEGDFEFSCNMGLGSGSFTGCIAEGLYSFLYRPLSWGAAKAAGFLDYFIYYSTNNSSYAGDSVEMAWGAVRDIANIFFIIALLYVAIKTILGLNVSDNKKLIGSIIIVALLINFSLFFTKVVIDGSNILAKVFYNNINVKGEAKNVTEDIGQKSISEGLVSMFNPQEIAGENGTYKDKGNDVGLFIIVTLLTALISGIMIYIFISVALLFVARVVGLWIAMIFSPIAFASYTVPFDIPGFGHKKWWENLLKNAFLAPIFVFFLYVILLFRDAFSQIAGDVKATVTDLDGLMHVIIPFALVTILLMKAKKLAVEYSGDIGAAVSKIGAVVGGTAVALGAGMAAFGARATIGRAGAALSEKGWVKDLAGDKYFGALGRGLQDFGKFAGKGSMDLRGIKIGGKSLASTGLSVGEAGGKGGFEKAREDKVKKRQERAKSLEVSEDEPLKQALNKSEVDLQNLLKANSKELSDLDKMIEKKREALRDTTARFGGGSQQAQQAGLELQNIKDKKKALKDGQNYLGDKDLAGNITGVNAKNYSNVNAGTYVDANGVTQTRTINHLEDVEIRDRKYDIEEKERERKMNYAEASTTTWNNFWTAARGGSYLGNREAAHKIIMDVKLDSGEKH